MVTAVMRVVIRHFLHFCVAVSKLSKVVEQERKVKLTGAGENKTMFIRTS